MQGEFARDRPAHQTAPESSYLHRIRRLLEAVLDQHGHDVTGSPQPIQAALETRLPNGHTSMVLFASN